ncbi:hypothetical protein [Sulfurirhabdus autotrophica]|uniref:Uncharacterized protein n=1 Tax=Sulfurirhabdus autotrophica TaxID=1706046 RepID=A0A4R3XTA7_9PROT|nr:hypothetical protein [Sulfurirhabdus autotrophica]TCV82905.1 hypothetical protein EDC63_11834 [Sulfurirhabdus autotrophica]
MKLFAKTLVNTTLGFFAFVTCSYAAIDNTAPAVKLQTSCTEAGVALNNCFTSMGALTSWINYTRLPNKTAPLVVNIGPGTFGRLALTCNAAANYTGYVSFSGSGPKQSVIQFAAGGSPPFGIIESNGCTNLSFSSLRVSSGDSAGGMNYGYIVWNGGGMSQWSNVVAEVSARGWSEDTCGSTKGEHYWMGSRFVNTALVGIGTGYSATCDDSWFIGSEITLTTRKKGILTAYNGDFVAISAANNTEVHVYGSVIRAIGPDASTSTGSLTAVSATSNGQVHLHGTGIDVLSAEARNVIALSAASGGMIHANGSAYNLSTASGTVTRIANNGGHIHAPYLWEHIPTAPLISVTGADMTTVATGTSDGHPHLAIYDTTCVSKWYDTVDKVCRP